MNKRLLIISLALIFALNLSSQISEYQNHGFWGAIEYRQMYCFSYNSVYASHSGLKGMPTGNSLRATGAYFIDPRLSLGGGVGIETNGMGDGTLPLFVDVRGYLNDTRYSPFAYITSGLSFKSSSFEKSCFFEIGVGYKLQIFRKIGIMANLGYNLRRFPNTQFIDISQNPYYPILTADPMFAPMTYHSISVGLGICF